MGDDMETEYLLYLPCEKTWQNYQPLLATFPSFPTFLAIYNAPLLQIASKGNSTSTSEVGLDDGRSEVQRTKALRCSACGNSFRMISSCATLGNECFHKFKCNRCLCVPVRRQENFKRTAYECDSCPKVLKSRCSLIAHMKRHLDTKPHVCVTCNRGFVNLPELKEHAATHGPKHFKCETCGKGFHYKSALNLHRNTHSDVRNFKCLSCPKKFKSSKDLRQHTLFHSETKRYTCDQCDLAFHTYGNLTTHIRFVHNDERPYSCDKCTKTFKTKGNLQSHLKRHESTRLFSCPKCSKKFKTNKELQAHISTYTTSRPFVCSKCPKDFKTKYTHGFSSPLVLGGDFFFEK